MIAPFTIITFHCHQIDLEDRLKQPSELAQVLESTAAHRTEIYLGAYVFDTRKGWQDMHRLCEFLTHKRHAFLRLPFEGELYVLATAKTVSALEKMGATVLPYPLNE